MSSYLKKNLPSIIVFAAFLVFVGVSAILEFEAGRRMSATFVSFLGHMVRILPCVFVLIGLFEVWVKREVIERHLGEGAGLKSHVYAILLAGTTIGGLHVALPVAHALKVKGARLGVMLTYIFASCICRAPMTLFEASFLGWRFTLVRFVVSLPLIVLFASLIGRWWKDRPLPSVGG